MGAIGITEGAIPFAASDPLRVIPIIMAGSSVAAVIAMLAESATRAHGGPSSCPFVDHRLIYILAIAAGSLTVAFLMNLIKAKSAARDAAKEDA